ncbi:MAG: cysteine--tRNA ligase [Candidatus Levybacteria bacterium]|nr:cysteine--tRNA ligase [Candidatus Levybacteria bacterium]
MKVYNTLTRLIEEFKPINPPHVGMYSCGPTVYDYQHIGHMRRYVGDDILVRVLEMNKYKVRHVMNITDVGHLTSDSDTGEDKMEKGAKKFGMSVWDIAKKFEKQFFDSEKALNIKKPDEIMHATSYIEDQLALVEALEKKGFTYIIQGDGVYFDTSKFPDYFKLSHQKQEDLKKGARVEFVEGKKNITDFALWKFSPSGVVKRRQMEWESPWGIGFPGWHIECSAMSMRALGQTLDIHTGGIDHINIHHTNEIAQSQAATGKEFVHYWVHHNFLQVEGQKMSKSLGNFYTVQDVQAKNFDPMALRYLYLQTHYRQEMNFTWESLEAAQTSFNRLTDEVSKWGEPKIGCAEFEQQFMDAVNDDLNMPKALAVMWELVRSAYPTSAKAESLFKFDEVLGLGIQKVSRVPPVRQAQGKQVSRVPREVMELVKEREELRKQKRFHLADQLRNKIKKMGYEIRDEEDGTTKISPI